MITNLEDVPLKEWIHVKSSNIYQVWYDPEIQVLKIAFAPEGSGVSYYAYRDVHPIIFMGLLNAESKGKYFWQNIRGRYSYVRLGYGGS